MIVLETMGKKLADAGINTLICITVVFVILILIAFIIGLFKYINKAETAIAKRKAAKAEAGKTETDAISNTISQIEQKEQEELVDDFELVAVIAAAIAASTGTSADGFVVRSIKKVRR